MYNDSFQRLSADSIAKSVKSDGFFLSENALSSDYIDSLLQEVNFNQMLVNTNDVGTVLAHHQRFLTHCLAKSKAIYNIVTSPQILAICKAYFDDVYKLTNHRIYQTRYISHMPWHTDNNRQIGNQLTSKHSMPGLLFLFYLSDVTQNPFQLVENSQHWSHNYDEIYFNDEFIQRNYGNQILTFPLSKGTLMICNIHTVHRAKPFCDRNYTRTTLLFQVDQVGSHNLGHGEKNLINTEFIDQLTPELMTYLGFGFRTDYPAFPDSSVATMALEDIVTLQKHLFSQIGKAVFKQMAKAILPEEVIIKAKRVAWHLRSNPS
ncbi:MAG: phytanoyl-CoA dioxygenase [Halothece sp.]